MTATYFIGYWPSAISPPTVEEGGGLTAKSHFQAWARQSFVK